MKGLVFFSLTKTGLYFNQYNKLIWLAKDQFTAAVLKYIEQEFPEYNWSVESEEIHSKKKPNIVGFYLQSDTLVRSSLPLINNDELQASEIFIPSFNQENSDVELNEHNIQYKQYSYSALKKSRIDLLVVLNDWTKYAKRIILDARKLKVPTLCIQESMIDFDNSNRMQFADMVAIQGIWYLSRLDTKLSFITGNPRYENLIASKKGTGNEVLVNCNFTYGIYENFREQWLQDVSSILQSEKVPYSISQHPRDNGDIENYGKIINSSASKIQEQLSNTKLLITRFSSLIHEALFLKIPVIYYNPHKELQINNLEVDEKVIFQAKTPKQLKVLITQLIITKLSDVLFEDYIERNCMSLKSEKLPSEKLCDILATVRVPVKKLTLKNMLLRIFYSKYFRIISLSIRNHIR